MNKILAAISVLVGLIAVVASSSAATSGDCSLVPKSEWAQCIFDQAASGGGE